MVLFTALFDFFVSLLNQIQESIMSRALSGIKSLLLGDDDTGQLTLTLESVSSIGNLTDQGIRKYTIHLKIIS